MRVAVTLLEYKTACPCLGNVEKVPRSWRNNGSRSGISMLSNNSPNKPNWGPQQNGLRCAILNLKQGMELQVVIRNETTDAVFLAPNDKVVDIWRGDDTVKLGLKVVARHEQENASDLCVAPGECVSINVPALPLTCLRSGNYSLVISCRPLFDESWKPIFIDQASATELVSGPFEVTIGQREQSPWPKGWRSPMPSRISDRHRPMRSSLPAVLPHALTPIPVTSPWQRDLLPSPTVATRHVRFSEDSQSTMG